MTHVRKELPGRLAGRIDLRSACVAIALLYVATRTLQLRRFPPFLDEATYATWTLAGFEDVHYRFVALANGKEPLLTWLGMAWMTLGIEPLTAVRLVSVASGLVTLVMVGLVARRLWGDRVGVVAAALCVFVPLLVVHDAIGIMEPLVAAAATSALYLQIRLAERATLDVALLLGIALAAGLLTKESGKFALVLLPLSLLCFDWRPPEAVGRLARWAGGAALALVMAGVGYSVLMLSDYWDDLGPAREALGMHRPLGDALSHPWRGVSENWSLFVDALDGYLTTPLLLLAVLGAGIALKERPRVAALVLAWALFPLVALLVLANVPFPRYIVSAVPPLLILAALGLVRLWEWTAARGGTVTASAAAALLSVPTLVFDARVLADPLAFGIPGSTTASSQRTGRRGAPGRRWPTSWNAAPVEARPACSWGSGARPRFSFCFAIRRTSSSSARAIRCASPLHTRSRTASRRRPEEACSICGRCGRPTVRAEGRRCAFSSEDPSGTVASTRRRTSSAPVSASPTTSSTHSSRRTRRSSTGTGSGSCHRPR